MRSTQSYLLPLAIGAFLLAAAVVAVSSVLPGPAAHATSTTVIVSPSGMNGWGFFDDNGHGGTGDLTFGPGAPPLGAGSAHLAVSATNQGYIAAGGASYAGTPLSSITTLSYSTYRTSGDPAQAISLGFNVDYNITDGNLAYQGRLTYEPYYTHTVTTGSWQSWDTLDSSGTGNWWASNVIGSGSCPISNPCTWSEVLSDFPNIGIHAVYGAAVLKAGSGWASFNGNADALTIGVSGADTTFDFEPECTTTCYVNETTGDDSFSGATPASAKKTIGAAISSVSSGGTVSVAGGTYAEDVTVNKGITLVGENPPDGGGAAIVDGTVDITAAGATVESLRVAPGSVSGSERAIAVYAGDATVTGNLIDGMTGDGTGSIIGIGIFGGSLPALQNIDVNNNVIKNIDNQMTGIHYAGAIGISVQNLVDGVDVTGNAIMDIDSAGWAYGIEVTPSAGSPSGPPQDVLVQQNSISSVNDFVWANPPNPPYPGIGLSIDESSTGANDGDASQVTVTDNSFATTVPLGIINKDTSATLDASGNWWGSNAPGTVSTRVLGSVDYTPWLDSGADTAPGTSGFQGSFSTLDVDDNSPQTGATGRIEEGINLVSGSTVNVMPGTYNENLIIDKTLTLAGAGQATTTIRPAVSIPNPCAGSSLCGSATAASNIILVEASDVVIHDLTLDGDNPSLTSGIVRGGADLDARNGIVEDYYAGVYDNLDVHNVTVKNIYLRGIYASSGGNGFNFHDNVVKNVRGDDASIAIFNFGGAGTISANTVDDANDAISSNWSRGTQYLNNHVTNSGSGVHTDNNGGFGGVADLIQGNSVSDCSPDGYGVWTFAPFVGPTVTGNTVTNCSVGLAAARANGATPPVSIFTNNTVDGQNKPNSTGAYITTDGFGFGSTDVAVTFTNNNISHNTEGVVVEAQPGYTTTATITGNAISGNQVGIDVGGAAEIHYNQFLGNVTYGVENNTASLINAENNWWGTCDGPGPVGPGSGDNVSSNVDYDPWSTGPCDPDNDLLSTDQETLIYGTDPYNADTDGDHCNDGREVLPIGLHLQGGGRNPLNHWDYFNPSGDGKNRVDDILLVVNQYFKDDNDASPGLPPYAPGYNVETDRTLAGPELWRTGPPNGKQRIDDILNSVDQYFNDCS